MQVRTIILKEAISKLGVSRTLFPTHSLMPQKYVTMYIIVSSICSLIIMYRPILSILNNFYADNLFVSWLKSVSNSFIAYYSVKQAGILSLIPFCIYIDHLCYLVSVLVAI